jgi:hypothetical protein
MAQMYSGLCFFYFNFANKAQKCQGPCILGTSCLGAFNPTLPGQGQKQPHLLSRPITLKSQNYHNLKKKSYFST